MIRDIIIDEILIPSMEMLYRMDYDNIRLGVSERNICARLAHHMENLMRNYDEEHDDSPFKGYFADVEYNRMGNGDIKCYENSDCRPQKMVSDLLIQSRGVPQNYLAVEMKRKENRNIESIKSDRKRLCSLVKPNSHNTLSNCVHDTIVGAFITYSKRDVVIDIYQAHNNDGEYSETLNFETIEQIIDISHRKAFLNLTFRGRKD